MTSTSTETARLISYLTLPPAYCERLGGVQWSYLSPHLAHPSGEIAITFDAISDFIEGFASQRDLIPFPSLLHWAMICSPRLEFRLTRPEHLRLRDHFCACGQLWRNAGALIGWLSRDLPSAVDPPSANRICDRLRDEHQPMSQLAAMLNGLTTTAGEPALGFDALFAFASKALKPLSSDEIDHWLRFGRGALSDAGRKLAEEKPTPPGVGRIIDELLQRPRLAGVAPYLAQMIAALSVPTPRRRELSLPVGGYSDVVTRGTPDRMLPSQHALDEIDFLRRYSENELLYFQRDDPPSHPKRDLAVVMDQGIRTWGDVRLVLTAATLALAKNAAHASRPCAVYFTSRAQHFENALAGSEDEFAEALEASDLTHDPGATLEYVLQQETPIPRDVFLLTHPRNLDEEDVGIAARRLTGDNRLFALAVNGRGDAEVAEFRRGRPLRLRTFRVELMASALPANEASNSTARGWSGDVEWIDWPFRFGPDGPVRLFDFDYLSERVIGLSGQSMLRVWTISDGSSEMLPLPSAAAEWSMLIGMRGGFALLGKLNDQAVVAHYDFPKKKCRLHRTSFRVDTLSLGYNPATHSLMLLDTKGRSVLLTIECQAETPEVRASSREEGVNVFVDAAPFMTTEGVLARVPTLADLPFVSSIPVFCYEEGTGKAHVFAKDRRTIDMEYRSDNQTLPQQGFRFEKAELKEDVFALIGTIRNGMRILIAFSLPNGHFARMQTLGVASDASHRLSHDGGHVAFRTSAQFSVRYLRGATGADLFVRSGGFGRTGKLWVGERSFLVVCGGRSQVAHLVEWSRGPLAVHAEVSPTTIRDLEAARFRHPRLAEFVLNDPAQATETLFLEDLTKSGQRWQGFVRRGNAYFLIDRFGQVAVLDGDRRVVFMMFFFGDSWTAWLPGDVRHGVGSPHYWNNSKAALAEMGTVLRRACEGASR